jgi:hypothetical protein
MIFEFPRRCYNEEFLYLMNLSQEDSLLTSLNMQSFNSKFFIDWKNFDASRDIFYENSLYAQTERDYLNNTYTNDDFFDDDLSLVRGYTRMFDASGYESHVSFSQRQNLMHQTSKKQWCSWGNSVGYHDNSDVRSMSNSSVHNPNVNTHLRGRLGIGQVPKYPKDCEFTPLLEKTLIKVRNVHPTTCLHELHLQRRDLFPMQVTFNTSKLSGGTLKDQFAVICNFNFNCRKLYTYHMDQNKSYTKLNAARKMLLKLRAIPNLTILLDEKVYLERMGRSSIQDACYFTCTIQIQKCILLRLFLRLFPRERRCDKS